MPTRFDLIGPAALFALIAQPPTAQAQPTEVVPSEPVLRYMLSAPLQNGCTNDSDGDCLDDDLEADLAWIVAPIFFLDEKEDCAEPPGGDYSLRPFFQVRPLASANNPVSSWPTGSGERRVTIRYFLNWPVDCGTWAETNHLGDSELIEISLRSFDLVTWELRGTIQYAHGRSYVKQGVWLDNMADQIGAPYITVAVEDDKHGSWWGKAPNSEHCAGYEDNFGFGAIDCFPGKDWGQAAQDGDFFFVDLTGDQNIGEPRDVADGRDFLPPAAVFINDNGVVRFKTASQYRAGASHLNNLSGTEYWWDPPPEHKEFCGWACPDYERESDGTCDSITVGLLGGQYLTSGDCAAGLQFKLSRASSHFNPASSSSPLSLPPDLNSCSGLGCGTREAPQICYCDELCHHRSDCCADKTAECGGFTPYSCQGKCGRRWADPFVSGPCSCSWGCDVRGDCCTDAFVQCEPELTAPQPIGSCFERCGFDGVDPQGNHDCACDHLCSGRGDCCSDKDEFCPLTVETIVGSCQNGCALGVPQTQPPYAGGGGTPPSYGGFCFCDPACVERGDCCDDVEQQCGISVHPDWVPPYLEYNMTVTQTYCADNYKNCRRIQMLLGASPSVQLDGLDFYWEDEE